MKKYFEDNRRTLPYELIEVPDAFNVEGMSGPQQAPPQPQQRSVPPRVVKRRRGVRLDRSEKRAEGECVNVPEVDLRKYITEEEVKITAIEGGPRIC